LARARLAICRRSSAASVAGFSHVPTDARTRFQRDAGGSGWFVRQRALEAVDEGTVAQHAFVPLVRLARGGDDTAATAEAPDESRPEARRRPDAAAMKAR
jgi:hypothetical protein